MRRIKGQEIDGVGEYGRIFYRKETGRRETRLTPQMKHALINYGIKRIKRLHPDAVATEWAVEASHDWGMRIFEVALWSSWP